MRRFVAVDDCGVRINPMIVEGQMHGGLADGVGMALMQAITFDADGQLPGRLVHGLPAAHVAWSARRWELGATVTPWPHHPIGAKGVGESATVGSPAAVVNAVMDALAPVRRAARRHAAHPGQRLVAPSRAARCAPTWPSLS